MRPIVTVVAWSICFCLSVTTVNCAKTTEPIVMSSGVWTREGPDNHTLGGGSDPQEWHFWGEYMGMLRVGCGRYSYRYSLGGRSDASSVYQSAAAAT